jgi:hypothetical protein
VPIVHKRATIRVVRGVRTADGAPADASVVTVEYAAVKGSMPPNGPMFPELRVGEVAVFPLKQGAGKVWNFVSEEDYGMIVPAVDREIAAGWPANVDGPTAFLCREVAGAMVLGDFGQIAAAARYLDSLGEDKLQPVDVVFALIKAEIGENLMREDSRWLTMGVASYIAAGTPRPTLEALLGGRVTAGGGGDDLPARGALRMAALNLRKASKMQQPERILMMLVSHQEDPTTAWGVATALIDNFGGSSMLNAMEKPEFRTGKPGALYIADYMVKGRESPLAEAAVAGACKALAPDGAGREVPEGQLYSETLRRAVGLVLRAGNDDDFGVLVDEIKRAGLHDSKAYEAFLVLAGDSELSPPQRVLQICGLYVDNKTLMEFSPWPGMRLCDMAALTAARVGKQDFGMNPQDAVEKRDAAVAKAAEWLKGRGTEAQRQ